MIPRKRVAIIGAGPAGAIAIDALVREQAFDVIRVFERREGAGGCWIGDTSPPPPVTNLPALASRTADTRILPPDMLPCETAKVDQPRFEESSIYPYLHTNVTAEAMQFSQEAIPDDISSLSRSLYGDGTPYRPWTTIRDYILSLVNRNGYQNLVLYNTTVELAEKVHDQWKLTLRRGGQECDSWWTESFDALVVASGHWHVPYIPHVPGLENFEASRPGSVLHSKHFRGRDGFKGKRVVVVGASVSGADISVDLTQSASLPVHSVVDGRNPNIYFGDVAFDHPKILRHPSVSHIESRTVHFIDGTSIHNVDHIIFGTGYSWTLPFLPNVKIRNNRVPGLYHHVVYREDPSLCMVGAVSAGLTFKIFEWQAVLAARVLAGRTELPSLREMERWEEERIREKGDSAKFTLVFPDFELYFEELRKLAGSGKAGLGRQLPVFKKEWADNMLRWHEKRKDMFRRLNATAAQEIAFKSDKEAAGRETLVLHEKVGQRLMVREVNVLPDIVRVSG